MTLKWDQVLASRAERLLPLPFDDVDRISQQEGVIFFAGGTPPVEMLPIARLRQAMADTWEDPAGFLYYDESKGHEPLRELIAARMAARGVKTDIDHILITNGSQQGLDLVARSLFDPGDVVVVEAPTYFGALQVFDAYQVQYRLAPIDENGVIPEALEEILKQEPRPKAFYTIPTFQNPTGVTLSAERRQAVVELSHRYNVAIIEDDPYGELSFPGQPARPLRELDADIIYLGTFSKTLAPALRMGWVVMPDALVAPVTNSKEAVDIQSDRAVQRAVTLAAADGWLDAHLDEARVLYAARCQRMLCALEREMPAGTQWVHPSGGFFLWVTLPGELTGDDLMETAARHGVAYYPGSAFYPDHHHEPTLRLGFTTLSDEEIDEGIRRLGRATAEMLERG